MRYSNETTGGSMTEPLFPELVAEITDPLPIPCKWPLFVLAYRPNIGGWGDRWKIHFPLDFSGPDDPQLLSKIAELQAKGWLHVTIMRLPAVGPWSEKK